MSCGTDFFRNAATPASRSVCTLADDNDFNNAKVEDILRKAEGGSGGKGVAQLCREAVRRSLTAALVDMDQQARERLRPERGIHARLPRPCPFPAPALLLPPVHGPTPQIDCTRSPCQ